MQEPNPINGSRPLYSGSLLSCAQRDSGGHHTNPKRKRGFRLLSPRLRFGIDQANRYCCHTLTSCDSIGSGPLGAGTLVSATARNQGGNAPMFFCGIDTEVPPHPGRALRSFRRSRAGTS